MTVIPYRESLKGTRADAIVYEVKRGSQPGGSFKRAAPFGWLVSVFGLRRI